MPSRFFIPVRRDDLVEMLCAAPDLAAADQAQFRTFARLLMSTCHYEYNQLLERLKGDYAPFDPDSDTPRLPRLVQDEREPLLADLLADFSWIMERANYTRLTRQDLDPILHSCSAWGLRMDVDFRIFERLAIYIRGDSTERRPLRRLSRLYRKAEEEVPIFRRLVMIMKLRKNRRLGPQVDTSKVYLQIFKDIPQLDLSMLLPGARVRMTRLDQGKIGFPILSGLAMTVYNIAQDFSAVLANSMHNPSLLAWGLATGAFTYGTRCYFSYLGTRQRYNLNLTQVLHFQNLDANFGVLSRILDEAQEQECREVLLAYFYLWHRAGSAGWPPAMLQQVVNEELRKHAEAPLELEIDDAVRKLERLHLVEKVDDCYRAVPLQQGLEGLEATWCGYLRNQPVDRWAARCARRVEEVDFSL